MGIDDLGPLRDPPSTRNRAAEEKAALRDAPNRRGGITQDAALFGLGLGVRGLQWVTWKLVLWLIVAPAMVLLWFMLLAWVFVNPGSALSSLLWGASVFYWIMAIIICVALIALQVWALYAIYTLGLRAVDRLAYRLHPMRATVILWRKRRIAAALALGVNCFTIQMVAVVADYFSGQLSRFFTVLSQASPGTRLLLMAVLVQSLVLYWLPLLFQWSVVSAIGRPCDTTTGNAAGFN